MKSKGFNLDNFQTKQFDLENTSSKIALGAVVADCHSNYLNELNLFISHFNSIPNLIHLNNIDCKKGNN